ncbi:MAG: hypothetical protein ACREFF_03620 [Candidatus Udaeobacter sp.]
MCAVYMYVVDRDFGFAPNPFHGYCTLATCKPGIRSTAQLGDWVVGMGGKNLGATGRCVFAMEVTDKIDFQEYWTNRRYITKRPVRNGSSLRLVGDNIYHRDGETSEWQQADSHHSKPDGSPNPLNVQNDTKSDRVLISEHFLYFGREAPLVPAELLSATSFVNRQGHRRFDDEASKKLIEWLCVNFSSSLNLVAADPFNFDQSEKRYSGEGSKIV